MSQVDDSFRRWLRRLKRELASEGVVPDPYAEARLEEETARAHSFETRVQVEQFLKGFGKVSW